MVDGGAARAAACPRSGRGRPRAFNLQGPREPLSLPEFQRLFPDDAACAAYLEKARWGDGFACPHCGTAGEPFHIRAGEPIRASDLRPVETISKGTVVTMVVRAPGITLTATGRAIQAGATGDIIRVSNLKSHRIVQGTIVSPGRVDVQGAPRFIGGQDGKTP